MLSPYLDTRISPLKIRKIKGKSKMGNLSKILVRKGVDTAGAAPGGDDALKILVYSDLHLEFGTDFKPPKDTDADVMVLAGDILTLRDLRPLEKFLAEWKKPVLFVPGNHEYYTSIDMQNCEEYFKEWLAKKFPNAQLLLNEPVTIKGVNFFGGTMWTDLDGENKDAMAVAYALMNDYNYIKRGYRHLRPEDTLEFHRDFKEKLVKWFKMPMEGPRVVITHHAPVAKMNTAHADSKLAPAFNSLDMLAIIKKYQPQLWIYGHTHETDRQMVGRTLVVSNPRGYQDGDAIECTDFDEKHIQRVKR